MLDVMLPEIDGLALCRAVRRTADPTAPHLPIVMVTALGQPNQQQAGFAVGADDYVTKPFRLRELVARIRAALRRAPGEEEDSNAEVVEVADVRLDPIRHEVAVRGEPVQLALKEFDLLELLLVNAGRVLTRDTLMDRVWGPSYVGDTKTLDVHIKRLRAKIEENPSAPTRITTIRGLGYRYEKPKV